MLKCVCYMKYALLQELQMQNFTNTKSKCVSSGFNSIMHHGYKNTTLCHTKHIL